MDYKKAATILKDEICPDGSLHSMGDYMAWTPGDDNIVLDGEFSADELEAIVWWMKRYE